MGFNRPSDIFFIFGIFALVMIVVGYGVSSVVTQQNATNVDQTYFTGLQSTVRTTENTTSNINNALQSQTGQSETPNQENILIRGFYSILDLGQIASNITDNIGKLTNILHIPDEFKIIMIGLIVVTFAVVTYSWLRGANL